MRATGSGQAIGAEIFGKIAGSFVQPHGVQARGRRDQVAALPHGSTILAAPAPGATPQLFTVDRVDDSDAEFLTALVR